jgi:hypothetical protein
MASGTSHIIDVWAHLAQHREEVVRRAREGSVDTKLLIRSKGPIKIVRGSVITVHVSLPGLMVEPDQDTILWEGEIGNCQFSVHVPESMSAGICQGQAVLSIDGFPTTKLFFEIRIASHSTPVDKLAIKVQRYHAVFASYASEDTGAVLARIQGLRKARPDLDIFFAAAHIRPGEDWMERLRDEIVGRDALYLFWSKAASVSKYVDWEWRYAVKEHGIDFIDPVPLVNPNEVPPPTELSALHFNDWILAYNTGRPDQPMP